MPIKSETMTTRRKLLGMTAGIAGTATLAAVQPAAADIAPMSKASVGYQDVPQNGQVCGACVYFVFYPQTTAGVPASRCKLVAGPIAPAGWCEVWQAKG